MLFERLANGVVKHHKKIIALWIIILLPSVYGMLHINDVVVYQEVGMGPETTEAATASKIIDEQFPSAIANSTAILVIQSKDVRTTAIRDFSFALEQDVKEGARAQKLTSFDQYNTIYSVYNDAMASVVNTTASNLQITEDGINQIASIYYGMPANFLSVHNSTNSTASLIYGIPKLHKNSWDSLGSVTNATERDRQAYVNGYGFLKMALGLGFFPPGGVDILFDYYNLTCLKWNSTRDDPRYANDSVARAQKSVDDSVPEFADKYFSSPPEAKTMVYSIWSNWTISTWYIELLEPGKSNLPRLNEFANRTIYINMLSMMLDQTGSVPPSEIMRFLQYYNQTMVYWGNTTKNYHSASELLPKKMNEIMADDINTIAPAFINTVYTNDPVNREFSLLVLYSFSMDNFSDIIKIHSLSLTVMEKNLQENGIIFTKAQLDEIYKISKTPGDLRIKAYGHNIVATGTLDTYPMKLPNSVIANFVSGKNDTMLIIITFTKSSDANIETLRSIIAGAKKTNPPGSLALYLTGDSALGADLAGAAFSDVEKIDPVTVGLIIGLIMLFFMSVVAPFIPLMVMGIGIVVSQAILFLVGKFVAGIHYSVTILLFVTLLGAGCDYCIFIIARYREERRAGHDKEEAVRTSLTWAGESIATSGITVIIGFGALAVGSFSLMRTMGLVLAMSIAIALLIALTLLPSILLLAGDRVFWPSTNMKKKTWLDSKRDKKSGKRSFKKEHEGYFSGAARFSIKHAKAIVLVALLVAVPTTYAVMNFHSSFDFIATMPKTESTDGMKAMGDGFGQGNIMPTYIVVQFPTKIYDGNKFDTKTLNFIDRFAADIKTNVSGIEKVQLSTISSGIRIDNGTAWNSKSPDERNESLKASIGKDRRTVMLTVILKTEPFSRSSMSSINNLRDLAKHEKSQYPSLKNTEILVGGSTADLSDVQKVTDDDFKKMIVIVVIGIFAVLLLVLGSVLIPLRLILTITLSISWTLAMTMVIFEYMKGIPLLWLMPMILFVVMMGLGMDYDIFLCTRMREEVAKGASDVKAIVTSVERTGGIITACGAIMAGALGSMMLSSMGLLQEFGFALFFAIIIDATIVRIYLVPAIMVLLQKWNWWAPGRLQRVRREQNQKNILATDTKKKGDSLKSKLKETESKVTRKEK